MKLRNKKTGEIGEAGLVSTGEGKIIINNIKDVDEWYEYSSLADLNEEWEDVPEEPKEDGLDNIITLVEAYSSNDSERYPKEIVEKLKAWKRLKEARFAFGLPEYRLNEDSSIIGATGSIGFSCLCYEDFDKDLDLLFGGEE